MKILKTLWVFMLLCPSSSYAGEYSTREEVPFVADTVKADFPIDVTKESSTVELNAYRLTFAYLGERIGGISFHGYNPGKELKRHLRVWMTELWLTELWERRGNEQYQDKWVCVYDGDCTIPSGGSSSEHIPLIDISFDNPYTLEKSLITILKIECSGEIGEEPLYFEYDTGRKSPVARYAVMSDVKYLSGTVTDQDGRPVKDACVQLEFLDNVAAEGKTDAEGKYQLTVEQGNHGYKVSVSAEGYPTYRMEFKSIPIPEVDAGSVIEKDFVLCDKVCYKKDQRATIILPVAPTPAWGRYYRLVRRERSNVFFERVETPEANVPYVIFPNMDFELSTANYDLQQEPGITEAPHPEETNAYLEQRLEIMPWATLYGSYQNVDLMAEYEDIQLLMLDTTPDCWVDGFWGRVGAFRAYMAVLGPGMDPINLIFPDEPTDVSDIKATPASPRVYDLQGRRIDGTPEKGLYIRDGRKFIAR